MSVVLIVDDVAAMREQYAYDLQRLGGHTTLTAASGAEAIQMLQNEAIDCLILDLEMPGVDGFEVLKTLQQRGPRIPVIVYTGTGNYERCVRAVKLGAYSFIAKDEPLARVAREVENAVAWGHLSSEVADLRRRSGQDTPLIGEGPALTQLKERIARVAPIPSPVLVLGESGSGKEVVAREIHRQSGRTAGRFVAINCAAIPETLLESELFGHERGAFTGADRLRKGAFETASGGTLFLDEIGELPLAMQAKLLRALEEGAILRLGATKPIRINTRVIAATNRDLDREVAAGRFREDLLFRINVHALRVPPLRDRREDIPLLIDRFLERICARFGRKRQRAARDTIAMLQGYSWRRNNVRELNNVVERMVIACEADAEVIGPEHVPADVAEGRNQGTEETVAGTSRPPEPSRDDPLDRTGSLKDLKQEAELRIIRAALRRNDWHISRTAAELGLADHASLLKIMRRHGLKRPPTRS